MVEAVKKTEAIMVKVMVKDKVLSIASAYVPLVWCEEIQKEEFL